MELNRYVWGDEKGWTVGLKQLWEYLAQYCYLPRLYDHQVLVDAVKNGVARFDAPFAYATGVDDEGHHTGLVYQKQGQVYFDERSLLIHPDHVKAPPPPKSEAVYGEEGGDGPSDSVINDDSTPTLPPKAKKTTGYYGRVNVDPQRVNKDMGLIVEEVIERLTGLIGCDVAITLEIKAEYSDGFDESTIRTVSENSRTLKFEHFEFEK